MRYTSAATAVSSQRTHHSTAAEAYPVQTVSSFRLLRLAFIIYTPLLYARGCAARASLWRCECSILYSYNVYRGYEITMTDLMNVFYELDVDHTGVVCLADFERLMLQLSFGPDAALRLFQRLDTDGDGALSLSDWTLSLIHISEPTRLRRSRMPYSA